MGEWLEIGASKRRAYLAVPESGNGAGVLILHAWWGLTPVFTEICDRLADEGFVSLAPDLYADNATTESIEDAEKMVNANSSADAAAATEKLLLAAIEELRNMPIVDSNHVGVIGYSMGGYWALNMSQLSGNHVGAVVTVYGTGDDDFSNATAAYLGHFAELDNFEPLENVRALEKSIRNAGLDVEFHVYPGTGHWFVEPNRSDVYNAEAAGLVWDRTMSFLKTRLN